MRLRQTLIIIGLCAGVSTSALAQTTPGSEKPPKDEAPKPIEVTADESLEWYQDQHIYVARGHAKAVRNDMVVEADILKAHEREQLAKDTTKGKTATPAKPVPATAPANTPAAGMKQTSGDKNETGDIDKMEADGNVRITDPKSRTLGDHAIYDLNTHTILVTGNNLRYETEKQTVTAKDSLEYYEDKKVAVARGHAIEDDATRHIEGDVMTAEFADTPNGQNDLTKVTAEGHVVVVTKTDTVFGDHGVFDSARNIAIITGNVHITRPDGTQLTGDVAESDFNNNESRILNSGKGRVRALLPQKTTEKATASKTATDKTGNAKPNNPATTPQNATNTP
jgi:lipopolysaccharide export system protein LptA